MRKDILGYALLVIIGVLGFALMCINAEHIDEKKELSNPTQTEIR